MPSEDEFRLYKERHAREHTDLEKQLMQHSFNFTKTEERLTQGSQAFDDLRRSISDLATTISPKPMSAGKITMIVLSIITGIGSIVGGVIWTAAKYPDRDEFNQSKAQMESLATKQAVIEAKAITTSTAMQRMEEQQEKIADKIDEAITATRTRTRRR